LSGNRDAFETAEIEESDQRAGKHARRASDEALVVDEAKPDDLDEEHVVGGSSEPRERTG
jgi:hypothetical protein